MTCPHDFSEREAAVTVDGYCPLCMARKIENLSVMRGDGAVAASPILYAALCELAGAVTTEVNENGGSGYLLARLHDARTALARAKELVAANETAGLPEK